MRCDTSTHSYLQSYRHRQGPNDRRVEYPSYSIRRIWLGRTGLAASLHPRQMGWPGLNLIDDQGLDDVTHHIEDDRRVGSGKWTFACACDRSDYIAAKPSGARDSDGIDPQSNGETGAELGQTRTIWKNSKEIPIPASAEFSSRSDARLEPAFLTGENGLVLHHICDGDQGPAI